jgi:hypothetical protein
MRKQLLCALFCTSVLAGSALAQTVDAPEVESPSAKGSLFVRGGYGHRFESDLDDSSGDFQTNDARFDVGGTAVFGSGVRWLNIVGYGYNNYDADQVDADVYNVTAASILAFPVAPSLHLMAGPLLSFYAEEGADWGDAVSYGGLVGATYRHSPELSIGLATAVMARIEEGVGIAPIPMIDWRFAPQWKLYTGITEVAARRGIGGFVAWSIADNVELAAGAQFERRRFRLEDDGATADYIVEDKSVPVYARLSWQMAESFGLDIYGGAAVGGELELNDKQDDHVGDRKYDPAPIVGARLRLELSGL